jgi:hypothetical protein
VLRFFSAAPGRADDVAVMGENLGGEDYSEERSRVMFRARWPEIMRPQSGLESQGP